MVEKSQAALLSVAALTAMGELPPSASKADKPTTRRKFCSGCGGNMLIDKDHQDACRCPQPRSP